VNEELEFARAKNRFCHAKSIFINLDSRDSFMELSQKISYALAAFALASAILAGMGLHFGAHFGTHIGVFEIGGGTDR
jgi:hypothetical protein